MQALLDSVRTLSPKERQALAALLKRKGINLYGVTPVLPRSPDETMTLSYAQQRLWFLWQLEPQSTAYNLSTVLRLRGNLDLTALEQAFRNVIGRHEMLRTRFVETATGVEQQVSAQVDFRLPMESIQASSLQAVIDSKLSHHFDLAKGELLQAHVLRLAEDDHVLVLVQHHIVSDGWSMAIMVEELVQAYEASRRGLVAALPDMAIQYADYAIWQRNWMEAGEQERQLAYWQQTLGGEQPVLELPLDRPRPAVQNFAGARKVLELGSELTRQLRMLARGSGVTMFMLLLASYQALLHRYSGQSDIRVGVPTANRTRVETERLIGFFVNTQVLKIEFSGELSVVSLLAEVKKAVLAAQAHQDLPFEQLVEALQPERSMSHTPLFQVMFNHQAAISGQGRDLPGLRVENVESEGQAAQFDLSLDTFEQGDHLTACLSYATALFDAATAERFLGHWRNLLTAMAEAPGARVAELVIMGEEEQDQILRRLDQRDRIALEHEPVHVRIERQAARQPDAVALICEGAQLTYAELNCQANRLAHRLRAVGVGPDVLVGLAAERSLAMVVGLLGVLKAGGAYVPLDPDYPADRLGYMIEDSGIRLLLTQEHLEHRLLLPEGLKCLYLEDAGVGQPEGDLEDLGCGTSLAYVMYTSGSTGRPKGVAIDRQSLATHAQVFAGFAGLIESDRVLQFSTLNFDGFVEQLYPALTVGASVVIRGPSIWDSETFYRQLIELDISFVDLTTAYWFMLVNDFARVGPRPYGRLRQLHIGGEAMPPEGADAWRRAGLGHVRLLNTYGPTEATVTVTQFDCQPLVEGAVVPATMVPIGETLAGRTIYILDDEGQMTVPGARGELMIGGDLLARGYFQRPALTAERFVPDPFAADGGRLYRTGDLARYGCAGELTYAGRIDHQVKVRGFRIELGEIEAQIQALKGVREVLVLAVDGPLGKQLVAYVVPAFPGEDPRAALRSSLKESLPDYMVPSYWMLMYAMPMSPNGKLDRKALPAPDTGSTQRMHVAPVSELECQLAAIWAQVLRVEAVGLNDDFFELGGHSLLAVQVISRVRRELDMEVPLRAMFEANDLVGFAARVSNAGTDVLPPLAKVERTGPLALSYAQQRQWFLWQLDPSSPAYNVPSALRLKGALDLDALGMAFTKLLERHEPLRTTFRQDGEQSVQVIHASVPLDLAMDTGTEADVRQWAEAEATRSFDLEQGPLLRVRLLHLAEDDHVLVLTLHHIVADGGSMPVLVDELVKLYQGAELPALEIQYADFAVWQRQWMEAGEQQRQLGYWTQKLGGEQPVLELPLDRPRPNVQDTRGAALPIALGVDLSLSLKALAREQGVTVAQLLLASFQLLLARYSGQSDIRVGMPIANRTRLETERLIGFFVNTLVFKAVFDGQLTVTGLLAQVKRTAIEVQAHQDLPFEQLVEALAPARNLGISPLFQALFNHQTEVRGDVRELPGLHVEDVEWGGESAKFDLSLSTFDGEQGIHAGFTYATALFDETTIARMARHWRNLLLAMVADAGQRVVELPMLESDEQKLLLDQWNDTAAQFPAEQCIQSLIETQVVRTPDGVALAFGDQSLTYAALNTRANQLAHQLRALGVGPDVVVGIAAERSVEMVVGLLGILKAGGAYVPLDPEYPRDRLAYMIEDSGISLLLTQGHLR
ncbi:non-ribosomal peptide synthetase, partial [Pseudomonas sp. S13.1.2]|uniref:non-ribosomal peptide synthetase n=1 Tax=Pseudomonas sp. S13.1.2 TaxID=1217722 RepID=UPI0012F834A8